MDIQKLFANLRVDDHANSMISRQITRLFYCEAATPITRLARYECFLWRCENECA